MFTKTARNMERGNEAIEELRGKLELTLSGDCLTSEYGLHWSLAHISVKSSLTLISTWM